MSLLSGDLTTLTMLQQYGVNLPSAAIQGGLITRISRWILGELNRASILPRTYTDYISGSGNGQLVLPNWPVLSISSIYIDSVLQREAVSIIVNGVAAYETAFGWAFQSWNGVPPGEPAVVTMDNGARFWRGTRNIGLTYRAGYQVTDEAWTIPTENAFTITPLQPFGIWATDEGVTYDDGTALTPISSGSPDVGEYLSPSPDGSEPRNFYTFSEDDAGAGVLLSYGYVPADLEQVALELILSRSEWRKNPGIRSKSLAGQETVVYDNSALSATGAAIINAYKSVLPPNMGVFV